MKIEKNGLLKGVLCSAFFVCMNLIASRYYLTKDGEYHRYYYQQNKELSNFSKTIICKYNDDGSIFAHGSKNTVQDRLSECELWNNHWEFLKSRATRSTLADVILDRVGQRFICLSKNTSKQQERLVWIDLLQKDLLFSKYARKINHIGITPSNNTLLFCTDESKLHIYDAMSKKTLVWTRFGKDYAFVTDKYVVEVARHSSLSSVLSVAKKPKEYALHGPELYAAEQVVVSHDRKIIAVAFTRNMGIVFLTQIILYDAEKLSEISSYGLPGKIDSGSRIGQHKSIYFSPDNKYLLVHINDTDGKRLSCYIDLNSGKITYIQHTEKNLILYELCGGTKTFGGLVQGKKALIYDIRNTHEASELFLPGIEAFALNPDSGSTIKGMLSAGGTLFCHTGSYTAAKYD